MSQNNDDEVPLDKTEKFMYNTNRKYSYQLDYPMSTMGYVEINEKNVILQLPEKNSTGNYKDSYTSYRKINIFLNKQLRYSSEWLPIYSYRDFYKILHMFYRVYSEFVKYLYYSETVHDNLYFDTLSTSICDNFFDLKSIEESTFSSIEINTCTKSDVKQSNLPKNFQLLIGDNIVLDFSRDFCNLPITHVYYILMFILEHVVRY